MSKTLATIQAALASLRREHGDLQSRLETARREREEIAALDIAPADVLAQVRGDLEGRRAAVLERLSARLERLTDLGDGDVTKQLEQRRGIDGSYALIRRDVNTALIDDEMLAVILEEGVFALVEEALQTRPGGRTIPAAKKVQELARLDKAIADLETEIAEVRKAATTAGVGL